MCLPNSINAYAYAKIIPLFLSNHFIYSITLYFEIDKSFRFYKVLVSYFVLSNLIASEIKIILYKNIKIYKKKSM